MTVGSGGGRRRGHGVRDEVRGRTTGAVGGGEVGEEEGASDSQRNTQYEAGDTAEGPVGLAEEHVGPIGGRRGVGALIPGGEDLSGRDGGLCDGRGSGRLRRYR